MNSFTELQHCTYISCFFTSVFQVPFIQLFHLSLLYSSPNVIVEKSPCTHLLTVEPVNDPVHFRTMYRHYYYYHPGIVYKMRIRKKKKKRPNLLLFPAIILHVKYFYKNHTKKMSFGQERTILRKYHRILGTFFSLMCVGIK